MLHLLHPYFRYSTHGNNWPTQFQAQTDLWLHPADHWWAQLPGATPIGTDAVWLICHMTLMTFEPVSLVWGGPLCLHFTSVVCICFYFRYKDLIIPTLGDKKKLSPEEKCRSVLQQTKLQGWQVCACVVCFGSYSVQINPTDLPNALIPDPLHKSFRGICDYSFQLSYLIIILIREHTHINPAHSLSCLAHCCCVWVRDPTGHISSRLAHAHTLLHNGKQTPIHIDCFT